MDKRGDNGSPCLSPRVTSKNSDNSIVLPNLTHDLTC